ncbi:hypothetical protein ASZ90_019376 [hydrocarbon metagenome]|uniref:Uncharacterized protein n=1 Tax=hydrocarbon metagenome TaxID=938273 RepID=A0A0W8E4A2_9ZZZZ
MNSGKRWKEKTRVRWPASMQQSEYFLLLALLYTVTAREESDNIYKQGRKSVKIVWLVYQGS